MALWIEMVAVKFATCVNETRQASALKITENWNGTKKKLTRKINAWTDCRRFLAQLRKESTSEGFVSANKFTITFLFTLRKQGFSLSNLFMFHFKKNQFCFSGMNMAATLNSLLLSQAKQKQSRSFSDSSLLSKKQAVVINSLRKKSVIINSLLCLSLWRR